MVRFSHWLLGLKPTVKQRPKVCDDLSVKVNIYKKPWSYQVLPFKDSFFSPKPISDDYTFETQCFHWPMARWHSQEGPLCEENMRGGIRSP